MADVINIGKRREVFWENTLVDELNTTTVFKMHEPVMRECVLTYDEPWACDTPTYNTVLQDGDLYRMYTHQRGNMAYAESRDGIHWEKPDFGMVEFKGSKHNNLLFDIEHHKDGAFGFDSFRPFIDDNPDCDPGERYKAMADNGNKVFMFAGPDGIHFKNMGWLDIKGHFDSVNTLLYDRHTGTYQAFIRDFHPTGDPTYHLWTRDIRFTASKTLYGKPWLIPKQLRYDSMSDWQMYINSIMKYYRADHMYIGFPSRYVERQEWTDNYEELCDREGRLARMKRVESVTGKAWGGDPRFGLAVSDTQFMTSRDGLNWTRYNEAFVRPGPEHPTNWNYGSVYFSNGIVETKSAHPGCDNEISFYCGENRWSLKPATIYRYTVRLDGFASMHGQYPEATLTLKPLIFDGKEMFINFSTSAYGHIRVTIKDVESGAQVTSCDTFGDSVNRRVRFGCDLSAFSGKKVVISFHMCDADLYSMIFQ